MSHPKSLKVLRHNRMIHSSQFSSQIQNLLNTCKLSVQDLIGNDSVLFFEEWIDSELAGVAGIEDFGEIGLLRSLAVSKQYRGNGLGRKLVRHVEDQAAEMEIHSLWLLTDSAAGFFVTLGYERANRSAAPDPIRQSSQFSNLCPASAVLMHKRL